MTSLKSEPCIFKKREVDANGTVHELFCSIFVDDLLYFSTSESMAEKFLTGLLLALCSLFFSLFFSLLFTERDLAACNNMAIGRIPRESWSHPWRGVLGWNS